MNSKEIFLFSVFSYTIAIIILANYALAEYDCSAKDDGWYYDPEFCHIYWRCIHGTAEEFECASGTAWDHHENRCNWLDSIDCTRSDTTPSKSKSDDDDDDGGGGDVSEENSDAGGANDDDDQPPTVVKRKKKKKKTKNRKVDSNKRMLDSDKNEKLNGKDHREIDIIV